MSKRTPLKGKPAFSSISDDRIKELVDLAQQMLFVYEGCDAEKVRVLTEVWKELSEEYTDRLCNEPFIQPLVEPESVTTHKIKVVKPLKRIKH